MIVCCSPGYAAKRGSSDAPRAILGHRAIAYGRVGQAAPWLFPRPEGSVERVEPDADMLLDDLDAIGDAAVAGLASRGSPSGS